MAENALYMMHNPSGMVVGNANDMRSMADVLDKVRGSMLKVYSGKSGKEDQDIVPLLDAETWMNADEALEAGFIDEIGSRMDMAACARFIPVMAKAGFKRIPDNIDGEKENPSPKDLEDIANIHQRNQVKVAQSKQTRRDRVADLLIRAELVSPK